MAARRDRRQVRRYTAYEWNFVAIKWNFENPESDQHDSTKDRIAGALFGSIAPLTYFIELP
jgi:hypothetical protein